MSAKEKMAVNLLNRGMDIDKIVQKMRISKTWLELQRERTI